MLCGGEEASHERVSNSHSTIWNHISKSINLGLRGRRNESEIVHGKIFWSILFVKRL